MKCPKCGGHRFVTMDETDRMVEKCMACGKSERHYPALDLLPVELHDEYRRKRELEGQL